KNAVIEGIPQRRTKPITLREYGICFLAGIAFQVLPECFAEMTQHIRNRILIICKKPRPSVLEADNTLCRYVKQFFVAIGGDRCVRSQKRIQRKVLTVKSNRRIFSDDTGHALTEIPVQYRWQIIAPNVPILFQGAAYLVFVN